MSMGKAEEGRSSISRGNPVYVVFESHLESDFWIQPRLIGYPLSNNSYFGSISPSRMRLH